MSTSLTTESYYRVIADSVRGDNPLTVGCFRNQSEAEGYAFRRGIFGGNAKVQQETGYILTVGPGEVLEPGEYVLGSTIPGRFTFPNLVLR